MKILLIDDDTLGRRILAAALENDGHMIIQSGNGRHGRETLSLNPDIDLLITDMVMPDMDGRELVKWVRMSHSSPALPVMLISGVCNQEEVSDLAKMGAFCFCRKPVNLDNIRQGIQSLFERRAAAQVERSIL